MEVYPQKGINSEPYIVMVYHNVLKESSSLPDSPQLMTTIWPWLMLIIWTNGHSACYNII